MRPRRAACASRCAACASRLAAAEGEVRAARVVRAPARLRAQARVRRGDCAVGGSEKEERRARGAARARRAAHPAARAQLARRLQRVALEKVETAPHGAGARRAVRARGAVSGAGAAARARRLAAAPRCARAAGALARPPRRSRGRFGLCRPSQFAQLRPPTADATVHARGAHRTACTASARRHAAPREHLRGADGRSCNTQQRSSPPRDGRV
jgi:hypothetical protein